MRAVRVDTVVHTLTRIDSFDLDARRAHETNVIGTLNLLAGCAGADSPVRRFVLKSSGHVYGSRPDLPPNLREDFPLDSDSPHAFVRDMVEAEAYVSEFAQRHPAMEILSLRFANSLNPEEPQPLARYLDLEVVPTVGGHDPRLQLIHRDDCVEALLRATLSGRPGAYNIASPRPRTLVELLESAGKVHAPLIPPVALGLTAALLQRLGLAFLSPQLLDLLRYGRTLSTARAARELGFRARHDTASAFADYIQERRMVRYLPDRQAYLYEKELEDFIHSRAQALDQDGAAPAGESAGAPRPRSRPRRSRSPDR